MRPVIFIALLAVSGCTPFLEWFGSDDKAKEPPVAVPTPDSLGALGDNIDKGDSKVASAVTVMIENRSKPVVVESEGKLALAHLPKPEDDDLKAARSRAALGDAKVYEAEIAKAKAWLKAVEEEWNEAVKQSKKNADELIQARKDLDISKQEVVALKKEIKRVEEESSRNLWTIAAVGLFVIGVLAGAIPLIGWRVGASIIACSPLAAAIPAIINSQYFAWIVGVTIAIAACLLLWRLFDYIKDKNNEQP